MIFYVLLGSLLLFAVVVLLHQWATHELGDLPPEYRFPDEEVRID